MKPALTPIILLLGAISGVGQVPKPTPSDPVRQQQLATNRPVTVPPLLPAVKLRLVKDILKGKVSAALLKLASVSPPVTLSVANPVRGSDYLEFQNPTLVSPSTNEAWFDSPIKVVVPRIGLCFTVPSQGYYVFDFSVDMTDSLTFKAITGDFKEQSPVDSAHAIFVTNELNVGQSCFYASPEQSSWRFHSLEISQFKTGN